MSGVGERQQRADKKVDLKATMSIALKTQLYDFAEMCEEPVKTIAERLCIEGITNRYIAEEYAKWVRRDFRYNNTIVFGHPERPKLQLTPNGETGKVSMRFNKSDYDRLCDLAYALDITPSSTATVLIRLATKDEHFMQSFIYDLDVDESQLVKIKNFLKRTWAIYL